MDDAKLLPFDASKFLGSDEAIEESSSLRCA
jgi:hypothetical protein